MGHGFVHGTLCLAEPLRTVVVAPFRPWPRPPWLGYRHAIALLRAAIELHATPGVGALGRLLAAAKAP